MHLKIWHKLAIGFLLPLLGLTLVGAWAYQINQGIQQEIFAAQTSQALAQEARNLDLEVVQIQQWFSDVSATRAKDGLDDGFPQAEASYKRLQASLEAFRRHFTQEQNPSQLKLVREIDQAAKAYYEVGRVMAQGYVANGPATGNILMPQFDEASAQLQRVLKPLVQRQLQGSNQAMQQVLEMSAGFSTQLTRMVIIAFLLVGALGLVLTLTLAKSLRGMIGQLRGVAQGKADLSQRIPVTTQDEMGEMIRLFNQFMERLQGTVEEVIASSQTTSSLVAEVENQTNNLNQSALDMAARSQDISQASTQIKEHIKNHHDQQAVDRVIQKHSHKHVEDLIAPLGLLFVPIFFVLTGFTVNLATLFDVKILLIALGITIAAVIGKVVAGYAVKGVDRKIVGWGMVPRGEVGLIFATIGKGLGVVSDQVYSVIVIVVILTTLMTPPILSFLIKRMKTEAPA